VIVNWIAVGFRDAGGGRGDSRRRHKCLLWQWERKQRFGRISRCSKPCSNLSYTSIADRHARELGRTRPAMTNLIVGCGYLGRRIAGLWLAAGQRVIATTRSQDRAAELRQFGIEPILCDVLSLDSLATLPQVDTVVYCVGFDRAAGRSMRDV